MAAMKAAGDEGAEAPPTADARGHGCGDGQSADRQPR